MADLTLDQYAPLSHKHGLDGRGPALAPTWVPPDSERRLAAYRLLHASLANVARHFFSGNADENAEMVEFGDADLLVTRVAAAVTGEDPAIVVDGADVDDLPSVGDRPDDPPDDATDLERRIAAVRVARWVRDAEATVDAWTEAVDAQPALAERQAWLRQWADDDGFATKLPVLLGHALGLGDGVAVAGRDEVTGRPTVTVYDPGFWFPTADPRRVHLAWEEETVVDGLRRRWVRRLTYELAQALDADGEPETRTYPWSEDATPLTCWLTDARWPINDLGGRRADDFDPDRAVDVTVTDLRIDFLPIVHIPGRDVGDTYGASILARVAQLLDEIIATDTDVSHAQSFAAGPSIALAGASTDDQQVEPLTVFNVGPEGRMDVLDLSKGLAESREARADLLDRFSVNAEVPPEVLGRMSETELSGVAIGLRFGPFTSLVGALRGSTLPRLADLLTMVQRVAQANGLLEAGETPRARVVPGAFLPSDRAALVAEVTGLLVAKAISTATAVHLLVAGGLSVPDAAGEVARIRADDTEGAKNVAEALADEAAAARRLGVPVPERPAEGTLGGQS